MCVWPCVLTEKLDCLSCVAVSLCPETSASARFTEGTTVARADEPNASANQATNNNNQKSIRLAVATLCFVFSSAIGKMFWNSEASFSTTHTNSNRDTYANQRNGPPSLNCSNGRKFRFALYTLRDRTQFQYLICELTNFSKMSIILFRKNMSKTSKCS